MYRIIYLTDKSAYRAYTSDDYNQIADQHLYLKKCGFKIICIIDYKYNVILNKCPDFKIHYHQIEKYII
jgi:hypothetical protein